MAVKVHFLNCGTMYPRGAPLFVPYGERSCCLCLLLEAGGGLVLVDTGFGSGELEDPGRLGRVYGFVMNVRPRPEESAVRRVEKLGFKPEDVRDIVCTHLDPDHAGGLADFPHARVHVTEMELEALRNPASRRERIRYHAGQFAHGPRWVVHGYRGGEPWFGMGCVRGLPGLPEGIVLVPLPGHTRGQVGVAVDTGEGWILHCGDAYYVKEELREVGKGPLGTRAFRRVAHCDHARAMRTLAEVRRVLREHGDKVALIASHDQFEYRNLFGLPLD